MSEIKVEDAKRYLKAIKANKQKYLTCDLLANDIGVYADIIARDLSAFDPLINMDPSYDLRAIQGQLTEFVQAHTSKRVVSKKPMKLAETKYKSVNDFVFSKYVVAGGLMDRSIELTNKDLIELKKIIINEQKLRKKRR
ncbi:MAG: hypothetical protein MJ207_01570 [Bacilli bacterium]|nr:hypothetical protein [Bacilli bacterium]